MSSMRKDQRKKSLNAMQDKQKSRDCTYVMYGYCKDDTSKTAYLQIAEKGCIGGHGIYSLVDDKKCATRFPSSPTGRISPKRFGTPKQWVKFFNEEEELADWHFHLVRVSK